VKKIKVKGLTSLQDTSSDEDDDQDNLIVDESENKPREDLARHLTFQLELVFINKIIKK
jgi:hypothetical protein